MGKKRSRSKKTSKGERRSIAKASIPVQTEADRIFHKLEARKRGHKVWMTVPNPDPNNTKARFIRIKV